LNSTYWDDLELPSSRIGSCGARTRNSGAPGEREKGRARGIRARATEAVKTLEGSPSGRPSVWAAERLVGDGGNGRSLAPVR